MTQHYTEQKFESHIEGHLLNSGYHKQSPLNYDRELCLVPEEVIKFIKSTQPAEYDKYHLQYGADTDTKLCYILSQEINKRGSLIVFRKGFKDKGIRFRLAYFKPSSGMNPEHLQLYQQNRFSIVRQFKFSQKDEKSLDIGIFLNGLPIITAELKNSLTGQFVEDAKKQYRQDRDPKEPLFKFKRCFVHFAVGNEKVFMTTRLSGHKTRFLPFNLEFENPVNPNGHKTSYLWEDILQQDTLLDLINNYLHEQKITEKYFEKDKGIVEKTNEVMIFPRFHQLDAVRKVLKSVKEEGAGNNYLIQHSAGSGKSNSIAWLSHQLSSLYQKDTDTERIFDSIVVVTDRRNLDRQLQNTIKQFEQTTGVVNPIEVNSQQLKTALEKGKDIIITTLQKFPVISKSITGLQGKRFAVIIDEVHSSQSGESSKHLKKVLSAGLEDAETEDKTELTLDEKILDEIKIRGKQPHISYFGFTATPKNKTLEIFGRKEGNEFMAFHYYTMQQAILEGFILDVLKNYTTFKRYFKLIKKVSDDKLYKKKKATQLLMSYVDLQPHSIEMKAQIMLEHFLDNTVNSIQGRGRAMVVTRSRLHAVKFYQTLRKLMSEKNLPIKPLVAFSGTVKDPDTDVDHTEKNMNTLPQKVDVEDAFKTPEYRILVVANKFQTGFDEPLLHTMYVDKKLGGVNAVQTLSRLNRTMSGKTGTMILDFTNEVDQIQESFQPYFQSTVLEGETDPDRLKNLEYELHDYNIFSEHDIEDFSNIFFDETKDSLMFQPILDKVVEVWKIREKDEREDFRSKIQSFIRLYGFISQIITFQDVEWEKLYNFARFLNRKLPKTKERLPLEVMDEVDLDSFRIQQTYKGDPSLTGDQGNGVLNPPTGGESGLTEDEEIMLSKILNSLNEAFQFEFSAEDKVDLKTIPEKLKKRDDLKDIMNPNNSIENIKLKFNQAVDSVILEFIHSKLDLHKKLVDPNVNKNLKNFWFDDFRKHHSQSV